MYLNLLFISVAVKNSGLKFISFQKKKTSCKKWLLSFYFQCHWRQRQTVELRKRKCWRHNRSIKQIWCWPQTVTTQTIRSGHCATCPQCLQDLTSTYGAHRAELGSPPLILFLLTPAASPSTPPPPLPPPTLIILQLSSPDPVDSWNRIISGLWCGSRVSTRSSLENHRVIFDRSFFVISLCHVPFWASFSTN